MITLMNVVKLVIDAVKISCDISYSHNQLFKGVVMKSGSASFEIFPKKYN